MPITVRAATAQYSRHSRVAKDLGIPEDLYREHLLLDPDQKIGSLMDISMDKDVAKVGLVLRHPTSR